MKLLITSGGTAGHVYPIIPVIEELKRKNNIEILFIGAKNSIEEKITRNYNIKYKGLSVGKIRNYFSWQNFIDPFKTMVGVIQAYFFIKRFKPDLVFAKGGFVTFPIIFWVKRFKLPLIIHESDVIPGKANRWASNFAKKICVGFPERYYETFFPTEKIVYTGNPIRQTTSSQKENDDKTILIMGGSQGAQKINEMVKEILPGLINYQVYHLVGERNIEEFQNINQTNYHPIGYTDEILNLMQKSDLIVARAGANTLAEIAHFALPSILIPYSAAAADHQTANAQVYEEAKAAVVLNETSLTAEQLLENIKSLMDNPAQRVMMSENAYKLDTPQAAMKIAEVLEESIKND